MYDLLRRKKELRAELIAQRDSIPAETRRELDEKIIARFMQLVSYRFAKTLLLYSPIGSEIDLTPLAYAAVRDGKGIAYPKCGPERSMVFYRVASPDELDGTGKYGIREPSPDLPVVDPADESTVMIVPALAWDETGCRIGYGGGYYDRYMAFFKGTRVGFCYSSNLRRELPKGHFDLSCSVLVTEKGVRTFDG